MIEQSKKTESTTGRPLSLALIGVGGMGATHLKYIGALERHHRVKLTAVADPNAASSRASLEGRGVRWYDDYRAMLDREAGLEAVQIVAPIPLHFKMAKACIERGLFVNLEKPPVALIQHLDELIRLDSAQRVAVGFQHISSVQIQLLKKWILQGKIGELRQIRATACWPRRTGYYQRNSWAGRMTAGEEPVYDGPATNALAHLIENGMFLAGATEEGFDSPVEVQAELNRVRPIESYDLASLRARFASGVNLIVTVTHATEGERPFQMEVRGSGGWARISNNGECLESHEGPNFFPPDMEMDPFARMHEDFVDFATGIRPRPRVRLIDTRGHVLATNGALISSGGIQDVSSGHFRTYGFGQEEGYHVHGLPELMERSFSEGLLLSELGAPWAHESSPIGLRELDALNLSDYISPGVPAG